MEALYPCTRAPCYDSSHRGRALLEGPHLADADSLGMLAGMGIAKDRPFNPDESTRAILDAAAKTAYKTSRIIGLEGGPDGADFRVFKDRRWLNPINNARTRWPNAGIDLSWLVSNGAYRNLDARLWFFTDYYSISPGMVSMTPGRGAFYMIAFDDAGGHPLQGDNSYKLHLPAKHSRQAVLVGQLATTTTRPADDRK